MGRDLPDPFLKDAHLFDFRLIPAVRLEDQ
jgi:hypothetical protein